MRNNSQALVTTSARDSKNPVTCSIKCKHYLHTPSMNDSAKNKLSLIGFYPFNLLSTFLLQHFRKWNKDVFGHWKTYPSLPIVLIHYVTEKITSHYSIFKNPKCIATSAPLHIKMIKTIILDLKILKQLQPIVPLLRRSQQKIAPPAILRQF